MCGHKPGVFEILGLQELRFLQGLVRTFPRRYQSREQAYCCNAQVVLVVREKASLYTGLTTWPRYSMSLGTNLHF